MHILPPTCEFWCFPSCMPSLLLYALANTIDIIYANTVFLFDMMYHQNMTLYILYIIYNEVCQQNECTVV